MQVAATYEIERTMSDLQLPTIDWKMKTGNDSNENIRPKKRILIISTWRSGSSFLGQLINSVPGVFYSYEPLFFFELYEGSKSKLIQSLFKCRFAADYLQHVNGVTKGGGDYFMSRNWRVWSACQHDRSLCYQPEFVRKICSHFPIHLIKVVRLRVKEIEKFLTNQSISKNNWKIVYLVRDPRGVMASRANLTWCHERAQVCLNPKQHCSEVLDDLTRIERLENSNPGLFSVIKFEDFTANIQLETKKLFQFLDIPITRLVRTFLSTHTNSDRENDDPSATYRHTKDVGSRWRSQLSHDVASNVTDLCQPLLKRLKYTF